MSELVLVRHGQASFGAASYDQLSETGLQQVQLLALHWQLTGEQFDVSYAGTLQRQQQTANALQSAVRSADVEIRAGLNEYNGEPLLRIYLRDHAAREGFAANLALPLTERKTFQLVLEAATKHWIAGTLEPDSSDSGFESWKSFQTRVHNTLDEIMQLHNKGSRVLISTSGGVIALALQHALKLPDNQTIETNWMVYNSSVTRLMYGRGKVSLSSFNSLPHLESPTFRKLVTYR